MTHEAQRGELDQTDVELAAGLPVTCTLGEALPAVPATESPVQDDNAEALPADSISSRPAMVKDALPADSMPPPPARVEGSALLAPAEPGQSGAAEISNQASDACRSAAGEASDNISRSISPLASALYCDVSLLTRSPRGEGNDDPASPFPAVSHADDCEVDAIRISSAGPDPEVACSPALHESVSVKERDLQAAENILIEKGEKAPAACTEESEPASKAVPEVVLSVNEVSQVADLPAAVPQEPSNQLTEDNGDMTVGSVPGAHPPMSVASPPASEAWVSGTVRADPSALADDSVLEDMVRRTVRATGSSVGDIEMTPAESQPLVPLCEKESMEADSILPAVCPPAAVACTPRPKEASQAPPDPSSCEDASPAVPHSPDMWDDAERFLDPDLPCVSASVSDSGDAGSLVIPADATMVEMLRSILAHQLRRSVNRDMVCLSTKQAELMEHHLGKLASYAQKIVHTLTFATQFFAKSQFDNETGDLEGSQIDERIAVAAPPRTMPGDLSVSGASMGMNHHMPKTMAGNSWESRRSRRPSGQSSACSTQNSSELTRPSRKPLRLSDSEILGLYRGAQKEAQMEADWRGIEGPPPDDGNKPGSAQAGVRDAHQIQPQPAFFSPISRDDETAQEYIQVLGRALQDSHRSGSTGGPLVGPAALAHDIVAPSSRGPGAVFCRAGGAQQKGGAEPIMPQVWHSPGRD